MGTFAKLLRAAGINIYMTAIEVWGPYIKEYQLEDIYDQVICSDVRFVDGRQFRSPDLIFCGDVLEHMSHSEAEILIDRMLNARAVLLASVPLFHCEQGEAYGNPWERHVEEDYTVEKLRSLHQSCVHVEVDAHIGVGVYAGLNVSRSLIRDICDRASFAANRNTNAYPIAEYAPEELITAVAHAYKN
ncbi:hypothetical protein [Methylobacterium oxalidis]|uniref:Methyltransferase type 11 domain-containing protein n=1 Tax=Methylobacterium oxalidis TaxID=944322 RepID=A0A512J248_9HYPH|nr:hypothetical protein [Methylobacterium oxalidis]GEP04007.1 hypothetical protein MOX02_20450 [Methylobacterium oxalidis]GLS64039.1 hypothetical protein GCM10007888_24200 [Methylobacterium oxalidis]